jgi:outer membrane murein-binding lipoprotein Lpp
MKKMIIALMIVLFLLISGCTSTAKSITDAYGSTKQTVENLNSQAGICRDESQFRDNIMVICPEKTISPTVNVTLSQSGK